MVTGTPALVLLPCLVFALLVLVQSGRRAWQMNRWIVNQGVRPASGEALGVNETVQAAGDIVFSKGEVALWRSAFLEAAALWAAFLVLVTEGLSLVHLLTREAVILVWIMALLALILFNLRTGWLVVGMRQARESLREQRLTRVDGILIVGMLAYLIILAVVSWLAPPNTNDSLAYHMPRVMHWIQDRSVAGYPTAIERQIWNPPGAEYIILHFTLLAGSDRLANFVQWGSLLGSLVAASLVAACLGAGRRGQWLAAWLVLTIPMAILQATSTQNDLATGFWVLATAAWIAQAAWRRSHQLTPLTGGEWGILGLTVGLGVLTKGTFYAFAAPLLVWLVVIVWRQGVLAVIRFGLSGVVLVVLLNAGIWTRNIQRYGQPLGQPGAVSTLANESFTPGAILSNLARNLGTQLATPIGPLNHVEVGALRLFHQVIGQNIDDPRTSLVPFRLQNELASEDFSGNPLHLLLVGVALLAFWPSGSAASRPVNNRDGPGKNRRTRIKVTIPGWYALGVVASFGLFSILYKWQPWGSRLLLPFFLLSAPLVARQFVHGLRPWVFPTLLSVTWLLGLIPLLANNARPVVLTGTPPVSVFTTSRSNLLFVNSPENQVAYGQLARWVPLAHCDQLALILNSYDIEYPLWAQLSPSGGALGNEVRIEHVDPEAPLAPIPGRLSGLRDEPPFQPCAVFISIYNYDTSRLPGFDLAESRLGFQLFLRKELMQYIR